MRPVIYSNFRQASMRHLTVENTIAAYYVPVWERQVDNGVGRNDMGYGHWLHG